MKILMKIVLAVENLIQYLMILVSFTLTVISAIWIVYLIIVKNYSDVIMWCCVLATSVYLNKSIGGANNGNTKT